MKKNYKVRITETLVMTVDVEAHSRDEAEQIASDNWHNSDYILDADNFVGVEFEATEEEPRMRYGSDAAVITKTDRARFAWHLFTKSGSAQRVS